MDICAKNKCSYCCREMWIHLEPGDITRMAESGLVDFTESDDSPNFIKRKDDACMFLIEDRCSIFAVRPVACRDFPFITYNGKSEVDTACLFFTEFTLDQ